MVRRLDGWLVGWLDGCAVEHKQNTHTNTHVYKQLIEREKGKHDTHIYTLMRNEEKRLHVEEGYTE